MSYPTFNYVDAWKREAAPRFAALPEAVRELALSMEREPVRNLHQRQDLGMVWPDDGGELWRRFVSFDDDTLARAAHVVHAFGHWFPGTERVRDAYGLDIGTLPNQFAAGGSWKFALYASELLAQRLGVPFREPCGENGFGVRIVDGELRRSFSSRDCWMWECIGLATRENLAALHACKVQPHSVVEHKQRFPDDATWRAHLDEAKAACNYARDIIDSKPFMIDSGEMERLHPPFPKRPARPAPIPFAPCPVLL